MTKALLAWEIGGGQGHLHLLATIGHKLVEYGIEPVFALKDARIQGLTLPGKVLQAPLATMHFFDEKGNDESYFYTDILYIFGFSSPLTLKYHLQALQNVINIVKPAFIIADYAPALVLAAKGLTKTIVVGNGFSIPPTTATFPPIWYLKN